MKYGNLTLIRDAERDRNGNKCAVFECVCGTVKTYRLSEVKNGRARSCGCVAKQAWQSKIYGHAMENIAKAKVRKAVGR